MNTNVTKTDLTELFKKFHNDESGATATEYIILLILVACFVIGIVKVFGNTMSGKFESANGAVGDLTF